MIYLKEKRFFAYCHWLNSQTGKIQGGTQKRVYKRHIQLLVSKTTSKLITITNDDMKVEEYKRMVSNITLIPGPRRVIASFQEPYIFSFHSQLIKHCR